MPTLVLCVDYRKAYDTVWHVGLLVKLYDLGIPITLMKMTDSWLGNRQAYIAFGDKVSEKYKIDIGLPQGSSLNSFLFIVYHCDLLQCLGAHSVRMFADNLDVLIKAPITKSPSHNHKLSGKIGYRSLQKNSSLRKEMETANQRTENSSSDFLQTDQAT
ncbi:unnamed protein product [Rotaria magnacalcarata]|uniref:Reverse transcriptase domain-containing protein n=1 Tax=Rotaria magnacalcarata TaxID=392030 RepID=A0A817AD35_9BILA|nr:unnamed protein product [Rotaria magnacalcarata]